jgi:hypothetical protein
MSAIPTYNQTRELLKQIPKEREKQYLNSIVKDVCNEKTWLPKKTK